MPCNTRGISSPIDYLYVKMVRKALLPICVWPEKELGENPPRVTRFLKYQAIGWSTVVGIIQMILYIFIHKDYITFFEIGHMYLCVFITINILVRYSILAFSTKYRNLVTDFLTQFHVFFSKGKSEYAMKTHKQIHLISHLFTIFMYGQVIAGGCLFNVIPMYNNYSSGKYVTGVPQNSTYEYSVYLYYPFNTDTDIRGYIFACSTGWLFSFLAAFWFCFVDLIISLMVFHVWGHFKILINNLESFPTPEPSAVMVEGINAAVNNGMYSESESVKITNLLKESVRYHHYIIKFTDRISDTFGAVILAYLGFHQISGCLLLLECSQMTAKALMRYLPLTIIAFQQLIQISVVFELVGTVTDKLSEAVYGLPWQYMDTKNRRTVIIFLMNVQTPIHIKALGIADVGVRTMTAIFKTSFSYFTFLRTMS